MISTFLYITGKENIDRPSIFGGTSRVLELFLKCSGLVHTGVPIAQVALAMMARLAAVLITENGLKVEVRASFSRYSLRKLLFRRGFHFRFGQPKTPT
jgi:hypothetical protein